MTLPIEGGTLNVRAAGIALEGGRVLVHRSTRDDFWSFPGGRIEPHEDAAATVVREFAEETGARVRAVRPLWIVENFFTHRNLDDPAERRFHEFGFYFLVEGEGLPPDGHRAFDSPGSTLEMEFRWMDAAGIAPITLFPLGAKERLLAAGLAPGRLGALEHLVVRE